MPDRDIVRRRLTSYVFVLVCVCVFVNILLQLHAAQTKQ